MRLPNRDVAADITLWRAPERHAVLYACGPPRYNPPLFKMAR
jgi:hypothetical protein